MAVIEVDGVNLDEDKLMELKPRCACCRRNQTRLILPTSSWNATGQFLVHCYVTGRMQPVDILKVLREQNLLDQVKAG